VPWRQPARNGLAFISLPFPFRFPQCFYLASDIELGDRNFFLFGPALNPANLFISRTFSRGALMRVSV
jgi:hypothetical protein